MFLLNFCVSLEFYVCDFFPTLDIMTLTLETSDIFNHGFQTILTWSLSFCDSNTLLKSILDSSLSSAPNHLYELSVESFQINLSFILLFAHHSRYNTWCCFSHQSWGRTTSLQSLDWNHMAVFQHMGIWADATIMSGEGTRQPLCLSRLSFPFRGDLGSCGIRGQHHWIKGVWIPSWLQRRKT